MKVRDKYPLKSLVKNYGFYVGWENSSMVSVNLDRNVGIGSNLWISNKWYYHDDPNIIVDLILKGIVVKD